MPSSSVSNTWPPLSDTSSPARSAAASVASRDDPAWGAATRCHAGVGGSRAPRPRRVADRYQPFGEQRCRFHSGLNWPLPSNTAQSKGSRWKSTESTSIQALVSCTSISGFRWRKRLRRGSSQRREWKAPSGAGWRRPRAGRCRPVPAHRSRRAARAAAGVPFGQPQLAAMALEQTTTEELFQGTDVPAHRALGYRQFLAGAGERACRAAASKARRAYSGAGDGSLGNYLFHDFYSCLASCFPFVEPCQPHRE